MCISVIYIDPGLPLNPLAFNSPRASQAVSLMQKITPALNEKKKIKVPKNAGKPKSHDSSKPASKAPKAKAKSTIAKQKAKSKPKKK